MKQVITLLLASTLIASCQKNSKINQIAGNLPEHLRPCAKLAMRVLSLSYEKAGENQGRLTSFPYGLQDDANRIIDVNISMNNQGELTITPTGTFTDPYNSSDPNLVSETKNSLTCNKIFYSEGAVEEGSYYITQKSDGEVSWKKEEKARMEK